MALSRRQLSIGGSALAVGLVLCGVLAGVWRIAGQRQPTEKRLRVKVKRVVNGHYVKLNKDDKLVYAGIRAPYENEPFHEEAKQRTVWTRIIDDAIRTSRGVDDITFLLDMHHGRHPTGYEQRTAHDYVYQNWNRPA